MTLAQAIYLLCALTSLATALFLFRYYLRRKTRLLLWSCIAFLGLVVNNVLLYLDLGLLPETDLSLLRTIGGAAGMLALAYALASEPQS
jgi:hypothetical protein